MTRRVLFCLAAAAVSAKRRTEVSIRGGDFLINGRLTYAGRRWRGMRIEGLLLNARMVQGTFDDLNPETRGKWAYPDTGRWDPERNTNEFVAAMAQWRRHGLLAFTVNLQGGSPEGYSQGRRQLWENSALDPNGELRPAFMSRLERILDRADELGMVAIVGYFYFGQDQVLGDEAAVRRGVVNATRWLLERGYRNVLVELNNECNIRSYDHEILKPERVPELIALARETRLGGRRVLVGTSFGRGSAPTPEVVRNSDFLLLHGNGTDDPERIRRLIREARGVETFRPMPVLINEDDHFRFDDGDHHMLAALGEHVSWGYFDAGNSDYVNGYQCPPVNWGINTERKRRFFARVKEVTGG